MSPIELYEKVAKQFKITDGKLVHPRQMKAYVESQIQEQSLIINRLIVDAARSHADIADAKDDTTKAAYENKLSGFENDLRQLSKTLDFFIELSKNLAKKYPEADSSKAERPDGF